MKDSFWSAFSWRSAIPWLVLIIGVGAYVLAFTTFYENKFVKEILMTVGNVLVVGVMFGFLSNVSQLLGIFKEELQKIIYGKEFLSCRKDMQALWESVSKELFKDKFPKISERLLKSVANYLPQDEVSFYDEYEPHYTITWEDREKGIISVQEETKFELIAESTNKFLYPLKTWTRVSPNSVYENKIESFTVNGSKPIVEFNDTYQECDNICHEQRIALQGSTKYEIAYIRKKKYCIDEDYYLGFCAKYIVNNLRVSLLLPEGIEAIFISRGTQEEFQDMSSTKKRIEKRYKKIILPKQGFVFALRKTN